MKKRKAPRSHEDVLQRVDKVARLIKQGGVTLREALDQVGLGDTQWHNNKPAGVLMRRSSEKVEQLAKRVHSLVQRGESIERATKRIGLKRSVYTNAVKRLGLPPIGATAGSVRADSLPPRPEKKKRMGYVPITEMPDMNSVQALATRIGLLDKKLAGVDGLKKQRKLVAQRLMQLLKGGR